MTPRAARKIAVGVFSLVAVVALVGVGMVFVLGACVLGQGLAW